MNDFVGDDSKPKLYIFVLDQRCAKVRVFMSTVGNLAPRVDMTELRRDFIVVRTAMAVLLLPEKSIRLMPTVSRDRCVSFLFCFMSQTRLPYATIFPFGTKWRGMNAIVFVPVGICHTFH